MLRGPFFGIEGLGEDNQSSAKLRSGRKQGPASGKFIAFKCQQIGLLGRLFES
jgi:hypothetical protein